MTNTVEIESYIRTLPLAESYWILPSLIVIYLFIVSGFGQWFMEKRRPFFGLRLIIPFYNIAQIVANGYIVYYAFQDIEFIHSAVDNLCGQTEQDITHLKTFVFLGYLWCLIKISDFLDTLFFLALKKNSHVSFLHIYHHSTTMLVAFIVFRFLHTEQSLIYAAVNCIVHVVMYTYYFLTSLGFRPVWKRLVTVLQLTQFFLLMIMSISLLFCQQSSLYFYFSVFGLFQCVMYLYLFGKFYLDNYRLPRMKCPRNVTISGNISFDVKGCKQE